MASTYSQCAVHPVWSETSQRTSISVDTLLDWALRYRNGGFEALAPQPRLDRGK